MRRRAFGSRYINSIRFGEKPSDQVLQLLRDHGFRYDRRLNEWYAHKSVESATVIDCIKAGETDPATVNERVSERQMEEQNGII